MSEGSGGSRPLVTSQVLSPRVKMRQFMVLMWKHLIVRKIKFIATPIELISPCFFFILMSVLKHNFMPDVSFKYMNMTLGETIRNTDTVLFENFHTPALILYSPESVHASNLMDEVGKKLKLSRLNALPSLRGYFGFSNDTLPAINDFIKDTRNVAVVIFEDMEGEAWPRKLNYTIRIQEDFKTHIYRSLDDGGSAHETFGTKYETFLRLQWAIDTSYISILSNDNITQNLDFQEFPSSIRESSNIYGSIILIVRVACGISLLLPFVFLLTRLLEERSTGVQELIRMVGVSNTLLAFSHLANMAATGLFYSICGTIVLKMTANPYIPNCSGFLIFVMLVFHFTSIMALAFVCSYLTRTAQYATSLAVVCYVLSVMPILTDRLLTVTIRPLVYLTGLMPHVPMAWFWKEVEMLERTGGNLDITTMFRAHSRVTGSAALAIVLLIFQTAIFLQLAWYLSQVLPGKYGVAKPWNFLFKPSYWRKVILRKVDSVTPIDDSEEEPIPTKDHRFFEDPAVNETSLQHDVGIRIANVHKTFGKNAALTNVSFDVYKGEITVLLGHNGAGKTTLMSIITGMTSATAGSVYVNGSDVSQSGGEFRRQLGLCPQHNLFFPDLTVTHHLLFFAMLKGSTYKEAHKSSIELLSRLGIEGKANSRSDELSGGMKRRLQLACALSGGASVLILDEPTSGLDVETRRELWDLLLSLRGDRTVLLTTHFMEEADALGDRVAALHKGKLRCYATPMYLKKNIGTGYRLSLTTIGLPKESAITSMIASVLPGATLKESSYNSISYNLPAQHSNKFPQLFAELESNRSQLGVDSIGVGVSSLEEVFLKLCSDVDTTFTQETVDSSAPEPTFRRMRGFPLYCRQLFVLMKRQLRYILFKRTTFLILQVFLPVVALFFLTHVLNTSEEDEHRNKLAPMNLDMYADMLDGKVLYKADEYAAAVDLVRKANKEFKFVKTSDVAETVLRAAHNSDLTEYNNYLVGFEINNTNAKVLYTAMIRHAAPVSLNLLTNILAAKHLPWADGRTITTNNHPLEGYVNYYDRKMKEPKEQIACATWVVVAVSLICSALANSVTLPIKELLSGTRHIHIMSGCPPAVHWLATLVFHTALYTVLLTLPFACITQLDTDDTLSRPEFVGAVILILVLGSAAFLSLCYLVSFSFTERGAGLFLTFIILFLGLVPGMFHGVDQVTGFWSAIVKLCNMLVPTATMTSALSAAAAVTRQNAFCELNLDKCPNIIPTWGLDVDQSCCALKKATLCILCMEGKAPGVQLIILALQLVLYMVLVILTQYGLFNNVYDRLVNFNYRPAPNRYNDEMVRAEKTYVNKGIELPPKQIGDAMLVNDVHKNYFSLLRPRSPVNAVKGVSFSVKKGECFGLLGVNGAGKSTTFKMISGEECPTRGGVFANGHHLKWPRSQYLQSLGYCPQFFGLDEFLTGQENLSLLLTLRGLEEKDVCSETDSWIEVVGLERYRNTLVEGYSGGCTRRLATAAALSSGAPVTLLDEPTSGVDVSARRRVWVALRKGLRQNRAVIITSHSGAPVTLLDEPTSGVDVSARRRVWVALRKGLRQNRAVIITSHSMDEMEALCDRIAIMSGGELGALGSACSLRAAYAAGHALVLKLGAQQRNTDVVDSAEPAITSLKEYLQQKFNCSLKDEHKTMLHYHINETMRYSELFSLLEQLKRQFPRLVEDYSVTETTLEEVFLSFAQPHPPAEPHPNNHPV